MDPLLMLAAAAYFIEHEGSENRRPVHVETRDAQTQTPGSSMIGTMGAVGSVTVQREAAGAPRSVIVCPGFVGSVGSAGSVIRNACAGKRNYANVSPTVAPRAAPAQLEYDSPCAKKRYVYVAHGPTMVQQLSEKLGPMLSHRQLSDFRRDRAIRLRDGDEGKDRRPREVPGHAGCVPLLTPKTQGHLLDHKGVFVPLSRIYKYKLACDDTPVERKGSVPTVESVEGTHVDEPALEPCYTAHTQEREIFQPTADVPQRNSTNYMRSCLKLLGRNTLSLTMFGRCPGPQRIVVGPNYVHWDDGTSGPTHSYRVEVYSTADVAGDRGMFVNPGELVKQLSKDLMCGLVGSYVDAAESDAVPTVHTVTVLTDSSNWDLVSLASDEAEHTQARVPRKHKLATFTLNLGLRHRDDVTRDMLQHFVTMSALNGLAHYKWLSEVGTVAEVHVAHNKQRLTQVTLGPDGQVSTLTGRPSDLWQPTGATCQKRAHTFAERRRLFLTVLGPQLLKLIGGRAYLFRAANLAELNRLHFKSDMWKHWLNYYRRLACWVSCGLCRPKGRIPELSLVSDSEEEGELLFPQCLLGQEFVPFRYVFDLGAQPVTVEERRDEAKSRNVKNAKVALAYTYWIPRIQGVANNK